MYPPDLVSSLSPETNVLVFCVSSTSVNGSALSLVLAVALFLRANAGSLFHSKSFSIVFALFDSCTTYILMCKVLLTCFVLLTDQHLLVVTISLLT